MTTSEPGLAAFALTAKTDQYLNLRGVTSDNRATFADNFERDQQGNGGFDTKGFLARLSEGELSALQKAHGLVEAINVAALSDEGAANLLRQFDQRVDLDNDGFVEVGTAAAWQFPPVHAPTDVKAAWEEAIQGLTDMEEMLKMAPFMAKVAGANVRFDAAGAPVDMADPGDPDFRNIFSEPGFSYSQMTRGLIADVERFKYTLSATDYAERKAFLEKFLTALERRGWSAA